MGPGNSSSILFTDQNDGDVEIKTDKFTLQNSGDITASNALFSGTAIAQNFVQKSALIHDRDIGENPPNIEQYYERIGLGGGRLYLDGDLGGEITNTVEFKLN